jgi:hypothetical protein
VSYRLPGKYHRSPPPNLTVTTSPACVVRATRRWLTVNNGGAADGVPQASLPPNSASRSSRAYGVQAMSCTSRSGLQTGAPI